MDFQGYRMTQGELVRGLGIPCCQLPIQCLPQTLVSVSPTTVLRKILARLSCPDCDC